MESIKHEKNELESRLQGLVDQVEQMAENGSAIADVERSLLSSLLGMGRELTQHYVRLREQAVHAEGTPKNSFEKKNET